MIAYHLSVDQIEAKGHPSFARLLCAGPWAYRLHPQGGTLAVWDTEGWRDKNADAFAAPRASVHAGLKYFGPKVMPALADLAGDGINHADAEAVDLGNGCTTRVLPVRLEPKRLLMSGAVGDPTTEYGITAWRVFDREKALGPDKALALLDPDLIRLGFLALRSTHPRLTEDLVDDLGAITTNNLDRLTGAAYASPKAKPVSAG